MRSAVSVFAVRIMIGVAAARRTCRATSSPGTSTINRNAAPA
jgi:hypothetical protein